MTRRQKRKRIPARTAEEGGPTVPVPVVTVAVLLLLVTTTTATATPAAATDAAMIAGFVNSQ